MVVCLGFHANWLGCCEVLFFNGPCPHDMFIFLLIQISKREIWPVTLLLFNWTNLFSSVCGITSKIREIWYIVTNWQGGAEDQRLTKERSNVSLSKTLWTIRKKDIKSHPTPCKHRQVLVEYFVICPAQFTEFKTKFLTMPWRDMDKNCWGQEQEES